MNRQHCASLLAGDFYENAFPAINQKKKRNAMLPEKFSSLGAWADVFNIGMFDSSRRIDSESDRENPFS